MGGKGSGRKPKKPYERKLTKPLWARQAGESEPAYVALKKYLDLGDHRSHIRVAEQLSKSAALMHRWAQMWSWRERAHAWDVEVEKRKREAELKATEEETKKYYKRMLNRSQAWQGISDNEAKKLGKKSKELAEQVLSPEQIIKFGVEGTNLEARASNQPESVTRTELTGPGGTKLDLDKLSVDELRELRRLLGRAKSEPDR